MCFIWQIRILFNIYLSKENRAVLYIKCTIKYRMKVEMRNMLIVLLWHKMCNQFFEYDYD